VVICLRRCADDLRMFQLMPLPPHLLLQYNPEQFTFLVPAYPGCPGEKAVKWIIVKKLDSLKRFVRTTVAASHN